MLRNVSSKDHSTVVTPVVSHAGSMRPGVRDRLPRTAFFRARFSGKFRGRLKVQLYAVSVASLVAVAALSLASVHFAKQTEAAADRVFQAGVVDLQEQVRFEALFVEHRRLVASATRETDRTRLQSSKRMLDDINVQMNEFLKHDQEVSDTRI